MRTVIALVAGLVATIAALVTVPLMWVSVHVVDEDGYATFSSTLATDDELQAALAAYLADDYVQRGLLPAELQAPATSALTAAAQLTTNQAGFVAAWEESQRSLHRSVFDDGTGPVTVDLGPLAGFVADRAAAGLPVSLPAPPALTVPIGSEQDRTRLADVQRAMTFGLVGLMVVVAAAALSIVVARSRPLALAGLGFGALATAGLLRVVTEIVTPRLLDETSPTTEFASTLRRLLLDRVSDSLVTWLGWIAVAGAAAVVLGVVGRLVAGRPSRDYA